MIDTTVITLNEYALQQNIKFLRNKLGKKVRLSSVVKANAYGHGIEQLIPMLCRAGIDHFAVFDYNEAKRVAKSLVSPARVMIMGWISTEKLKDAIRSGFEIYIFNLERLFSVVKYALLLNIKARIHLEVETGMNRSGLILPDLQKATDFIQGNHSYIEVVGFCTHLAGAESITNHLRIQKQLKKFQKFYSMVESVGIIPLYKHVANSAAAFVYPKTRMDMVRVGIMLYGFWPSSETFIQYISNKINKTDPLKRVLDWKSVVMNIKEVFTGEFVGYGISYQAQTDIKIALVPVGYSSGFSRSLSNQGRVLIQGTRCRVIGLVNMNMIIVDITHIPDAKINDEVILIGKQGDLEIKVSAFSDISNQLNYEILASLPGEITRKILK